MSSKNIKKENSFLLHLVENKICKSIGHFNRAGRVDLTRPNSSSTLNVTIFNLNNLVYNKKQFNNVYQELATLTKWLMELLKIFESPFSSILFTLQSNDKIYAIHKYGSTLAVYNSKTENIYLLYGIDIAETYLFKHHIIFNWDEDTDG